MNREPALRNIALAQIDFADLRYHLVPHQADNIPAGLRESILRTGLLHPPILKENLAGDFQLVAGRKRLLAARQALGLKTCGCLVLAAATGEVRIFSLILDEILTTRPPTPIELATFFSRIAPYLSRQEAAGQFLPRLGLTPHTHYIDRWLALLALEEPLRDGLHHGVLHETVAWELTKLAPDDRLLLFEIIRHLGLSVGKQKKIVSACRELAARQEASIGEIMAAAEVQQIIHHTGANRAQKAANLMMWLSKRLAPRFHEAEKKFKQFTGSLGLPPEASLAHSPAFEKNTLTLALTFTDQVEFLRVWQKIKPTLAGGDQPVTSAMRKKPMP